MTYTLGTDEATKMILQHPRTQASTGLYRKRGIWLASVVLAGPLRDPALLAHARQAPYPRLGALLDATRQAAVEYDDEDYWFVMPPSGARLRLDQIPLPAGTPGPAPEDPSLS